MCAAPTRFVDSTNGVSLALYDLGGDGRFGPLIGADAAQTGDAEFDCNCLSYRD